MKQIEAGALVLTGGFEVRGPLKVPGPLPAYPSTRLPTVGERF